MKNSSISLKDTLIDFIKNQQWGKALQCIEMHENEKDDKALRIVKYAVYSHVKESHMEKWLEYALQCEPNNAHLHCEQGMWLYRQGKREAALSSYTNALTLEPDNAVYHYYLGATLYNCGYLENALAEIQAALALDESFVKGWRKLNQIYTSMHSPEEALYAHNKAQLLEGDNVSILEAEKRWDDIITKVWDTPQEALTCTWAHAAAKASMHTQDFALIGRILAYLLSLFPEDAFLYLHKGQNHARQQAWPEALEAYEKAVALDMDSPRYHAYLGIFLCQRGRHSEAILPLRAALARDASKTAWWNSLARAYLYTGNQQAALDAYDNLLAFVEDPKARITRNALSNQIQQQSTAFSSDFYDAFYEQSTNYCLDAEQTPYLPLWQHITDALQQNGAKHVLDIGCGPGQFAAFLAQELPDIRYTGLDFSKVAIAQASKRCPQFRFEECTLPFDEYSNFVPFDAVICIEVLEHVKEDLAILSSLPKDVDIFVSVPSFDSAAHIRFFLEKEEVVARYATFFENFQLDIFPIGKQNVIYLMQGRRSDFKKIYC